ncbi:hypothetical protein CMI42_04670 [Candidatus Pacearchaeota archaeon]|nr:hypothetical protein [Candidatus Pacearchaeota archaeon]|tara:strand:- start:245 stop:889 length:645 start_codon:yes stop_codon:yes gene_type:complete
MRVSLIGPSDIEFHYHELLGVGDDKLNSELERIAGVLVDSDVEVEFLPDKGVCLEIAKLYKKKNGKKVIGAVPKSDSTFGIDHLKQYIEEQVDGKRLVDEVIDSGDWFKHDMIKGLMGNAVLYLGSSPGTDGERHYAVYLYKLLNRFKEGIEVSKEKIHSEIRAGKDYSIIVYSPFLIGGKLSKEDEKYMEKFGVKLYYVNSSEGLGDVLKEFK